MSEENVKRPEKRKFCSGQNQGKQKKKKRKESITRVGHSRNDLVDFFGRGLGSKKIHIIQQI